MYVCPRCNYNTNVKIDMRRHFSRKKQCPSIHADISREECISSHLICKKNRYQKVSFCDTKEVSKSIICDTNEVSKSIICDTKSRNFEKLEKNKNFECPNCKKTFSLKNNLYRHIKHFCKGEINYETLKQQNDKICLLEKEIEILKSKNETIQHIGVQNNIQNIYINALGKENREYITKEYVQNLVKDGPYACIQKLIKYIHFNPNHTENQNIRIPNKRDKFGQIFNGEKWVLENKIDMITTITENAFDIITEHCDDLNSKKYDKFCNEFENREKNCIKRISGDTELLILNYQEE